MKCPHCGQEHPDNFKFCPNTGKTIESQLKACTNKHCPDYGKHILPTESKYCPTCGSSISDTLDPCKVFLSFFDIVLGETNIYEIKADEYIKEEMEDDDEWPGLKVICIDAEFQDNKLLCLAKQSDKKVFSLLFDFGKNEIQLPNSWIEMGLKSDDIMLSLERILGMNGFVWTEFDEPCEGHSAIAYKNIDDNTYITFAVSEKLLQVMMLTEKMKDEVYDYFTKSEKLNETSNENGTTEEEINCPKCGSTNVEDDGTGYLQYMCNECENVWGHDDTKTCPECGSNDIEDDGTSYLQYACNDCGHVWGEEDDEDEDTTSDDPIFLRVRSIIVNILGVDESEVRYDSEFVSDLGVDSLDAVELVMEFEKEFCISIPDDKVETLYTVGDVIDYIKERL